MRRENASLRRQLAKLDLDRYQNVREIVQEHLAGEEIEEQTQSILDSMKNAWKCHSCNSGHLEINMYSKLGNPWYFRKCSNCDHRTLGQPYTASVKGIVKEVEITDPKDRFKKK